MSYFENPKNEKTPRKNHNYKKRNIQNGTLTNTTDNEQQNVSIIPIRTILTNDQVKKCKEFYVSALNNLAFHSYGYLKFEAETCLKEIIYLSKIIINYFKNISLNCDDVKKRDDEIKKITNSYYSKYNSTTENRIYSVVRGFFFLNNDKINDLAQEFLNHGMVNCFMVLSQQMNSNAKNTLAKKAEEFVYNEINKKYFLYFGFKLPVFVSTSNNNTNSTSNEKLNMKRAIENKLYLENDYNKYYYPLDKALPYHNNSNELTSYNNNSAVIQPLFFIFPLFLLVLLLRKLIN